MTNQIVAVSRTYRRISIYETNEGFEIIGANDRVYTFNTYAEACTFVDAWYAMQYIVSSK